MKRERAVLAFLLSVAGTCVLILLAGCASHYQPEGSPTPAGHQDNRARVWQPSCLFFCTGNASAGEAEAPGAAPPKAKPAPPKKPAPATPKNP